VVHDAHAATGGLVFVTSAYGLAGCFHLTECFYLLLVTKREAVGRIAGAGRAGGAQHRRSLSPLPLAPLHRRWPYAARHRL
jgi:hypothetical protein